jgi:hypothetical protein
MDYRTSQIIRRLKEAHSVLDGDAPLDVISIKFRDDCVSGFDYQRLVDELSHRRPRLVVEPAQALQGRAWLVTDDKLGRIIIVEHETGLEILGAIGSLASLVGLAPLVAGAWRSIRKRYKDYPPGCEEPIEIRRLEGDDALSEERAPSAEAYLLNVALRDQTKMLERISELERQVADLKSASAGTKTRTKRASRAKKKGK